MKKRWFAIVLTLCLTLAMMTVTAEAVVFYDSDHADNGRTITFTVDAIYRCVRGFETPVPVTDATSYAVKQVNSWTSDEIEFQIEVNSVSCGGGNSHNSHSFRPQTSRAVTFTGADLCHKKLNLTATMSSVIYGENDALIFTVTTDAPRYTLIEHPQADPTCDEYGYKQTCYECPKCGKFFEDQDTTELLDASKVRIPMTPHKYDEDGVCTVCKGEAEAYTLTSGGKTYYATVEDALKVAYGDSNNMSVWIARYAREDVITLTNSCRVYVCENVEIPEIRVSAPDLGTEYSTAFDITNRGGTIGKISYSEITSGNSVTATISNASGSIGTITPANSGEQSLDIRNWGTMTQINIPDNKSLRMEITNNTGATIGTIQRGNTATVEGMYVTIQNNGTITRLHGKKPIKLLSGIGTYGWITTEYTGSKSGELLADGCKFYRPSNGKTWHGSEYTLQGFNDFIVSTPPFSVTVTGPTGFQSDGSGGYSLTLAKEDVQDQKLSTSLSYPNANTSLSSEGANFTYGWYYTGADTAKWATAELPLNELAVGVHHLTLRVTDSEYNYTHSINVTVTITSENAEPISLKASGGPFTKVYDGTTGVPENLTIELVDSEGHTVPITVDTDYKIIQAAYNSKDCNDAAAITVQAALTANAQKTYSLSEDTLTVPAAITRADASYSLGQTTAAARVGDSIFQSLTFAGTWKGGQETLFDPATPGTGITVEGAPLSVTFYRLHPSNITKNSFIHDPSMNEELTADSIFTTAGTYYVYAIADPTRNFAGMTTSYLTITVQDTEASTEHHEGSAAWDGTTTVPIAAKETKSVYLSGSLPTVYTELLLSQQKTLTLCLNGKTLSATQSITSYNHIRVTDGAALTIEDCTKTGRVLGTTANGGEGGIAYVKNGTLTIEGGTFTGGIASTGGAIVVDDGGILNIDGGVISGNKVESGNGGAIYVKKGGVVNIYGGIIRDNQVLNGSGGAIYIAAGGTVNLFGGTITGNTASGLGGGIYVEEGGKLNVQGAPVVTGNTAGGKENNVYLPAGQFIAITKEGLNSGAQIGVTSESKSYPVFLANAAQDDSARFTADDENAVVVWLNNALALVQKPTVAVDDDGVTVSVGTNYLPESVVLVVAEYAENGQLIRVHTEIVQEGTGTYTYPVTAGARVQCFLLREGAYTPLTAAFEQIR